MNNFPAMTEEQRQALIKMAKRLSSGVEGNLIANLAKVSLAALTAEPAGKFAFEPLAERYHHIKHGEAQHMEPKLPMVKLFTAPPAPVLRLPDEADSSNLPFAAMAWNACLAEVKRLNAQPSPPETSNEQ